MPRGDWRNAIIFVIAAAIAFSLGALLIEQATRLQALIEQEADQKSAAYAQRARVRIERYCVRLSPVAKYQCIHEATQSAREGEHDERDLEAQLVTSVWTHYMGYAAIGGTAFGIIGMFLVLFTFRENRRAADAAHDANRPWIEVSVHVKGLWAGSSGANADVQYTLVNHGNSPATGVRLAAKMMAESAAEMPAPAPILDKVEEMLGRIDSNRPCGGSAIFPGGEEKGEFMLDVRADAIAADISAGAPSLRFLVAVGVSYMFGGRACHTVKCYGAFVRENVDYTTPNQLERIRFKAGDVTDTYAGFAT